MSTVVTAITPFPNIYWWSVVLPAEQVIFDAAEHFEKMTYRNRYYISGPNGLIQLSIPLQQGRNQRNAMSNVCISNGERWQTQQWRTLISVYNRAPYFNFYAQTLEGLFTEQFDSLMEFNLATIHWLKEQLKLSFKEATTEVYTKEYCNGEIDIRKNQKGGIERTGIETDNKYYQLFSERNGFLPNLSILDLLFSEGPHALQWIKSHKELIEKWQ